MRMAMRLADTSEPCALATLAPARRSFAAAQYIDRDYLSDAFLGIG
jgi:hypothetical protein